MEKVRTPWGALKIKARFIELFSPTEKADQIKNAVVIRGLKSTAFNIMYKAHERGYLTEWESEDLLQEACLRILSKEIKWSFRKDPDLVKNLILAMYKIRRELVVEEKKKLREARLMIFPEFVLPEYAPCKDEKEKIVRKLYAFLRNMLANDLRLRDDKYIWKILLYMEKGYTLRRAAAKLKIEYITAYHSLDTLKSVMTDEYRAEVRSFTLYLDQE